MVEYGRILVASADAVAAENLCENLQDTGHPCHFVSDPLDALNEARTGGYDVVMTNLDGDPDQGLAVLRAARRADKSCQVIVFTARRDPALAVAAMRDGALCYLQTPLNPSELTAVVDRASARVQIERDRGHKPIEEGDEFGFGDMIGRSRAMQKVFRKIVTVARTRATVLIQGETGTGKELVARAIHEHSPRAKRRFVPLNCAGLVESILESELFGHEKGAFTGAATARVGLFEYANNGTLFLDEVGDMPISSQTKLLRVLEQGELVRVGSNEPIKVDVRVIAATNHKLQEAIKDGTFRQDLFYRLNVITINLPPLRERQGDIPLLIDAFVREFSDSYEKPVHSMTAGARKALFRYHWPGNVRELRNCIEHMVVAGTDPILAEDDLPDYLLEEAGMLLEEPTFANLAGQPLEEMERLHIAKTLELVEGNREKAAELLGIGERTLYRKIQKYDLK